MFINFFIGHFSKQKNSFNEGDCFRAQSIQYIINIFRVFFLQINILNTSICKEL